MISRSWFKFFHWPLFFLLTLILFSLQTTFFVYPPLSLVQPNVTLLLIVWISLKRDFYTGGVITLLMGRLAEIQSAAPQGYLMICLMILFVCVQWVQRHLVFTTLGSFIYLTAACTIVFQSLLYGLILINAQRSVSGFEFLEHFFLSLASNCFTGIFLFRFLKGFDRLTYHDPRKRSHADEDSTLVEEGL
jgi:hypothetical protein